MATAFRWMNLGRDSKLRAIRRPLRGWRKKIENWRCETGSQLDGEKVRHVYLYPLNHNNSHFSLLEINEIEQKIFKQKRDQLYNGHPLYSTANKGG